MLNLNAGGKIVILSGEGIQGTYEEYKGKRTEKALKARLTKEKCHGDRWVRAYVYQHDSELGEVYVDIETGEPRHIKDADII